MSAAAGSRFLDLRALAALARLRFTTRQRIEGSYSGRHRARQPGGAAEFSDFREYAEGEDLRRLDWKVLARTGRAYTRLYQDETNLNCSIVLDASNSMRFGTPSKLEYVQYFASALAHLISLQQDQVGLALVARGLDRVLPPGGTPSHVARVLESVERIESQPVSDLAGGLRELFQRLTRRGVLLIASDFLVDDLDAVFAAIRLFRHRQWEVVVLHITHPDEERLPDGAAFRFEGMEGEAQIDCSPSEVRELYQAAFNAHSAAVRTLALAAGCDFCHVSTATPYLQTLGSFLVERSG